MKQIASRIFQTIWLLLVFTVILWLVWQIGNLLGLFENFPKGLDVYAYLFKVKYITTYFPNIFWNPLWNSGVPTFTWSYPPLSMFLAALIHAISGLTIETSLTAVAALGMLLLGVGVYLTVSEITTSRMVGLFSVILLYSLSGIWGWWADGGNYPRVLAVGFWVVFVGFLLIYLRRLKEDPGGKHRFGWLAVVLSLHACLTSHLLAGGLAVLLGALLILILAKRRVNEVFKIIGVGLLTAAYWYLPLFTTGHKTGSFFGGGVNQGAIFPKYFHTFDLIQPFYSWPPEFAYFLGGGVAVIILTFLASMLSKKLKMFKESSAISFLFLAMLAALVFYEVAHFFTWYPDKLFIDGLPALSAFFLTTLMGVLVAGLGLGALLKLIPFKPVREFIVLVILAASVINFSPVIKERLNVTRSYVQDVTNNQTPQPGFQKLLAPQEREANFRFGTDTAYVSDWWNWEKIDYPQTKDYFAQGTTYPNWQFWLENKIWKEENNYEETNFIFDWYGIKNFLVSIPNAKTRKYLAKGEDYRVLNCTEIAAENSCEFEYLEATPILSAVNQPVVLVIGGENDYEAAFRVLGQTGLGSKDQIWLRGTRSISDARGLQLKNVAAVILYGYQDTPPQIASELQKYVKEGGSLFIEANRDKESGLALPDPYPVSQVGKVSLKDDWSLIFNEKELATDTDWNQLFVGEINQEWGVALAAGAKDWAKTIVSAKGKELIVAGKFGKGKVVWSGVNLPYYALAHQSPAEVNLYKGIMMWLLEGKVTGGSARYQSDFINPQLFSVKVDQPAGGVLFKESFVSGWTAEVNGKKTKIWRAGPDLMYVSLAAVKNFPVTVKFRYHLFLTEKIGILISLATIAGMIDYLLGGRIISGIRKQIFVSKAKKDDEKDY